MAPSKFLGIHAPWHEVSRILGLSTPSESLPVRSPCPLCRGDRLTIYQDTTTESDWGYCFDCRFRGDMIELAAAVWKVSLQDAANRLAYEGAPFPPDSLTEEKLAAYVTRTVGHCQRLLEVWEKAQHQLLYGQSPEVNALRQRFGLTESFSRDRMRDGPAKLFGAINMKVLQNAVRPCAYRWPRSRDRLVHGAGWRDVMLVPYWNAPGRIAGFYVVGRRGNLEDRVYVPVWFVKSTKGNALRDSGLAGLDAILELPFSRILAVRDPLLLLRIQMRNFRHSLRPLPMVAWHTGNEGVTAASWAVLDNRRVVHWARKVDAHLLLQCQKTGGDLILAGPKVNGDRAMSHFLRGYQPGDLLQRLFKDARPWQERVARWLREAPEAEVLSVVHQCAAIGHDVRALFEECDPKNTVVARRILPASRQVTVGGARYVERNGRWYYGKTEKLLLNGTIRLERIVLRGRRSEHYGTLCIGENRIPFVVRRRRELDRFIPFLSQVALRAGKHLYWASKAPLYRIAMALHEPPILRGKTRVGWDGKGFRFRHFTVRGGQARVHEDWLLPDGCPGPQTPSSRLTDQGIRRLSRSSIECEWGWAVTISAVASILAPAIGLDGLKTLIVGEYASHAVERLAALYGVPTRLLHYETNSVYVRPVRWPHHWPIHLRADSHVRSGDLHTWIFSSGFPSMLLSCDPLQARVVLCQGGFVGVECHEVLKGEISPFADAVMAYLGYMTAGDRLGQLRRELHDPTATVDATEQQWRGTQASLAAWFRTVSGNPAVLKAASRWMRFQHDPGHFEQMVVWLYRKGLLRPVGGKSYQQSVRVEFDTHGLIVSADQLGQALRLARMSVPDTNVAAWPLLVPHASF